MKNKNKYTTFKPVLKENNLSSNEICPLCLREFKNTIPIGTFMEITNASICFDCTKKISPELAHCLELFLRNTSER